MTAVLCLALAGAAHAFTVEIVVPSTDPVLIATDRPQAFEAVAYDDQQQDITAQVSWSWDFDDGSAADTDNPTEHVFETAGDYTVTVTATFSAQQEQQQIGVDAQQPTGAFVLARQLPTGAYESLQGTEVCHHRYLIAFDAVPRNYDGVRFKSKRAWEQEFGVGTWVSPSQEIVLDGQLRPQAWVLFWSTSECPGQAVVGEPNGAVDWQIEGRYLDGLPPDDEQVYELIGAPTYTINNTVVSSATGVLRFDPADAELDECPISWTTGHQNIFGVKFTVPIHIYDLAGNELYTYTKQNAERTGDSWTWDGTIFEQEPEGPTTASKGIYTYRLGVVGSQGTCGGVHCACTAPGEGCARGDWDKSAFLTVAIDKFYWFEQDPVAGTLTGVVKYTLNQPAWPGSVTIRFFGPDLEELDYPLTGQPYLTGTHFSDVYQIEADYDENDQLVGPIYCVIYANECEDTALLNRAGDAKPALQMGTTTLQQVTVSLSADIPEVDPDDDPPGADTTLQHFVTPKGGAEDVATLTASITPDEPYLRQLIDWEGATEDAQDPLKATVPISAAAKHVVKIKLGGAVVKEARVWVVWADVSLDTYSPDVLVTVFRGSTAVEPAESIYMDHDIRPIEIITDTDRPDLDGGSVSTPPVANQAENCWHHGVALPDGVWRRWDASRRLRIVLHNPNGVSFADQAYECVHGMRYWDNWPNWPDDPAVGNDDRIWTDEEDDPYTAIQQPPKPVGSLKSWDRPTQGILADTGDVGDVVILRFYFQEFTRLELGEQEEAQWYCISDPFAWHVFFALRKVSEAVEGQDYDGDGQLDDEAWIDNGSSIGLD